MCCGSPGRSADLNFSVKKGPLQCYHSQEHQGRWNMIIWEERWSPGTFMIFFLDVWGAAVKMCSASSKIVFVLSACRGCPWVTTHCQWLLIWYFGNVNLYAVHQCYTQWIRLHLSQVFFLLSTHVGGCLVNDVQCQIHLAVGIWSFCSGFCFIWLCLQLCHWSLLVFHFL